MLSIVLTLLQVNHAQAMPFNEKSLIQDAIHALRSQLETHSSLIPLQPLNRLRSRHDIVARELKPG